MDGRADGHLRPTLLGRLGGVDQKISPVRGLTVDSSQLTFVPTSKSRDVTQQPSRISQIRPDQI